MFSSLRRRKLPTDKQPPLERDEWVVAWALVDDPGTGEGVVVATNRGLFLPARDTRLGWHQIHKAVWSGRELALTPAEVVDERDGHAVVADLPIVRHLLLDPGELPNQVRTRVTRSVAYTAHHPMPGGGGARVAARRVAGVNGLTWTVRYDLGTDADSAAVRQVTADLVAQSRVEVEPAETR
jgi:hypothetical protein